MKIRFFPERFLKEDLCFGLLRKGPDCKDDLPDTVEGDAGTPFHIIHSDPDHLAYLAGLIVLQAWTGGIAETGIPLAERRPLLVITDRAGRFADAYLQLHLPVEQIGKLSSRRRVALCESTGRAPDANTDKAGYWEFYLKPGDYRTRLHNFFPAYNIFKTDGEPHLISGRDFLGRGDDAAPALLITRRSDENTLHALIERYSPFLVIFDAHGHVAPVPVPGTPTINYHESIFSPQLARENPEKVILHSLPDTFFERFCSEASLRLIEPEEHQDLSGAWKDVDSALQALIERVNQRRDRVVVEVQRTASRLRNLLLSLPVGIESYEKALLASGVPPGLWLEWSVSESLQILENRIPEMAAFGEWEEFIFRELVDGFRKIEGLLRQISPKRKPLLESVSDSLTQSRRVALLVNSRSFASGLKWASRLPEPLGLGLPHEKVTAITANEIGSLEPDQDCIIHQAFDPGDIFPPLARAGPRRITLILSRNELRFVGEQFLRSGRLFPDHPANRTILRPIYQQIKGIEPVSIPSRHPRTPTLFPDSDFDMVMQMFNRGPRAIEPGMVLTDESDQHSEWVTEVEACLVRLEGESAVFLAKAGRVSCIRSDGSCTSGGVDTLEPGDRLIIINSAARESIAHRLLKVTRGREAVHQAGRVIKQWQQELSEGIARLHLTYSEVLHNIRELGSRRVSPLVIGQWARGDILGPLDVQDIRRIGQAVGSTWVMENWQHIGGALLTVRSGHRLLGRTITRIILRAAVSDCELSRQDEEFLKQAGITMGELRDAVTLLAVESVSREARIVPVDQIGMVIPV